MKAEIKEILDYMELGEEILPLREQVKNLDASDAATLQGTIDSLQSLVEQSDPHDRKHLGYYHLFLGCACHEQKDHKTATLHLKQSLRELRGSKNNKAVAHWLLSMNYASLKEYDKARRELIKAERLSTARRNAMEERVRMKIKDMFNSPIFAQVPPRPTPKISKSFHPSDAIAESPVLEKVGAAEGT
jgi:tetratricopeptide (TPR) repeat protein